MSEPIRAVLFDAGNTLIYLDPDRMLEIFRAEGVESDRDRFRRAELEARGRLARRVSDGETGTEKHVWQEYFLNLFRGAGVPEERLPAVGSRVKEAHEDLHLWTWVEPGTEEALETLTDRGYRLGVISNADGRVEQLLVRTGLRPHFEFVVDSHVVGVEKPDPRIFRHAVELLELDPGECVYVGDLYPVDVDGARRTGLRAVHLDPGADDPPRGETVPRIPSLTELPDLLTRWPG